VSLTVRSAQTRISASLMSFVCWRYTLSTKNDAADGGLEPRQLPQMSATLQWLCLADLRIPIPRCPPQAIAA
jgi:hypothetical protein